MANANLQAQFHKLCRLDRTGSFSTKRTYRQAMGQFLDYCSDHFHAMNINRLGDKHIRAFIQNQLDRGVGQRTLQKQVAAIKHFLLIAGVRVTVTNRQLGIAGRSYQALQGATNSEYQRIQVFCTQRGKVFEGLAVKTMYFFGLRSNEVVNLRYGTLRDAMRTGKLLIEHGTKGGRKRTLELSQQQMAAVRELEASRLNPDGRTESDKVFCSRQKDSVKKQYWRLHNFFSHYGDHLSDPGRTDTLSCHSFRRAFAQNLYDSCRKKGDSSEQAMRQVKTALGHSAKRGMDITGVYICNKW
jgi:site-specific recombinase XerD